MISIYRGNDKDFVFFRKDTSGNVIGTVPRDMMFTVKKDYMSKLILFSKTLNSGITQNSDGSWNIRIDAEDTKNLDASNEKTVLVCDVKIIDEDGNNVTIVKPQDFVVLPVVTN